MIKDWFKRNSKSVLILSILILAVIIEWIIHAFYNFQTGKGYTLQSPPISADELFYVLNLVLYTTAVCIILLAYRVYKTWLGKSSNYRAAVIAVFVIATLLRTGLCIVNYESNDDQFQAIRIILNEGRLPTLKDGIHCYHPKLYHATAAAVLKIFALDSPRGQIIAAQFLNCIAGILTIYIVWVFLNRRPLQDKIKFICFSIIALNPKLIGINSHAGNNSFVILFATAALYFAYRFFNETTLKNFSGLTVSAIFAALSKGNGLVLFVGILLVFALKLLVHPKISLSPRESYLKYLAIFLILFFAIVPICGQYWSTYKLYGNPLRVNIEKDPFPHFFEKTYPNSVRPGVTSIADAYFTFRFYYLIKYPVITNDKDNYPIHRTSLWSQLYGRAHFIYFDMWPFSWQTGNPTILNIGRAILILALLPSFFLIVAVMKETSIWLVAVYNCRFNFIAETSEWIFDVFLAGYIFSMIWFTLCYRDFASMKAVYIFPAFLSAIYLLSQGIDYIYKLNEKKSGLILFFDSTFALLFLLYCITVVSLIIKLSGQFAIG
jgi:hypothetical protein